jgi:phosphoserine phosphatase RsbU/P
VRRAEASEARATVLARTLQQSLLPPATPAIPGLDVAAAYRPAGQGDEVGGDFYDLFERRQGDWVVVIGDVRGKGAAAAVVTALARYTLRATAIHDPRPGPVLTALNEVLLREQGDASCTVALARLEAGDGGSWGVSVACGGHPLPLLVGRGAAPKPLGRPGTLLGLLDAVDVTEVSTTVRPGEALVFFTDGVTEARGDGDFYGDERLAALLGDLDGRTAEAMARTIVDVVVAFQHGNPRDDIAVVVVKVPPSP